MIVEFDTTITPSLIFSIVALVLAWWRTRRSAVDELFRSGRKRMEDLELRLQKVEQTILSMPSRDEMHQIQIAIERQTGALNAMGATMEGISKVMERLETIVSRHEDHLLNGAGK